MKSADSVLISEGLPDLLPMQNRSAGLHVSEIIESLCIKLGIFDGDKEHLTTTWAQLGCAMEDSIIGRYEREYEGEFVRPGEVEVDGIYLTPDGLWVNTLTVEEIKLSWMSSLHSPDQREICEVCGKGVACQKFWRYVVQLKAYCWALECRRGRLNVTFVNGNYRGVGPSNRVWQWDWTKRELQENWNLLRQHGARMLREREEASVISAEEFRNSTANAYLDSLDDPHE